MSTGVTVDDAVVEQFAEFKKASNKNIFIIYKIDNDTKIVSETASGETEDFNAFLTHLPENDCRYALYKMDFTTSDGRPSTKLVSIAWSPDTAKIKSKMVYAGSKDALTKVLVGVAVKITATDLSEVTETLVQDACRKFN
uniref:ADF-H domain-containing protein n=1 Tax=Spumella elongata TaxID=89044 RepID=A0A7S3HC02_9STRA|mmetsp:Transcript_44210/g.77084  ORF Transcript_44210/g.77084 Transcript_44210/m.77084 type:complete len:140 (+) Transcript_44210:77-496(+)